MKKQSQSKIRSKNYIFVDIKPDKESDSKKLDKKSNVSIINKNTITIILLILIYLQLVIAPPPEPHNVHGIIFYPNGSYYTQQQAPVTINDTANGEFRQTKTNGAGPAIVYASYATTIDGSTNDSIIVYSWNQTHYGTNTSNLSKTTTRVNVVIDTLRPSEPDVDIIIPQNSSVYNISTHFTVTANISIVGSNDATNCSTTIHFTSGLEIAQGESQLHMIGDINLGLANQTSYNVTSTTTGKKNITVVAQCTSDTLYVEKLNKAVVENITIRADAADVTLISPSNNTLLSIDDSPFLFEYNVTPVSANISNCSLIVDNQTLQLNNSINIGLNNFSQNISYGNHTWIVNCTDELTTLASSSQFNFRIREKDIIPLNIQFLPSSPVETQLVTINVTVQNRGDDNITQGFAVNISVFNSSGVHPISSTIVSEINASSNISVTATWTAVKANTTFQVFVDANLNVTESNESNNKKNASVFLSSYHIYYGNVTANIYLANVVNRTLLRWNTSYPQGNVYVIDSDSSITWAAVYPLGRNTSYNQTTDDFEELDTQLEMQNVPDNTNTTFTFNNSPKTQDSFIIFGTNITNVPIVNSTNTTNFVTGVLWDASDETVDQFNGSQDVIFVTKINPDNTGLYGLYDYEIKVPAQLRSFQKPNADNSLTFFYDLR